MNISEWTRSDSPRVADELLQLNGEHISGGGISGFGMRGRVEEMTSELKAALFPTLYERTADAKEHLDIEVANRLGNAALLLCGIVQDVLYNKCQRQKDKDCDRCAENAERISVDFMRSLSDIRRTLTTDIEAAYDGDPAARYMDEILLGYPSIEAVTTYRLAHRLYELDVPLIPRIMTECAHQRTGIDIHPGAAIGSYFFIDHGTGVVIGETCIIGDHVKLYQGVTLGAKSFELDADGNPVKGVKRHPNIEDDVIIYAGATILGGDTTVGRGSIIGGNVWLIESVPPRSKVYNATPSPNIRTAAD